MCMYRAQILLEDAQHRLLQRLAAQEKKSLSQMVREWITDRLSQFGEGKQDSLHGAAGLLKGKVKGSVDAKDLDTLIYRKDW